MNKAELRAYSENMKAEISDLDQKTLPERNFVSIRVLETKMDMIIKQGWTNTAVLVSILITILSTLLT